MLLSFVILGSCNQNAEQARTPVAATAQAQPDTTTVTPAPAFFIIPEELANQRVWVCDGARTDLFHVQHDCPVLVSCKGKGTFRNISIHRAIEVFGRYNCTVCSKELSSIFDENLVR